jgi:hypothetical protein
MKNPCRIAPGLGTTQNMTELTHKRCAKIEAFVQPIPSKGEESATVRRQAERSKAGNHAPERS